MTEEVQTLTEGQSVPATEVTATPEVQTEPATAEQVEEQKPEERKFTQAELDEIVSKRFAKERRKWEREQQARQAEAKAQVKVEVPPADQFATPEAYAEALAEKRAQELISQREAAKRQAEIMEAYADREEEARAKYDDFEQVAYNQQLPITDAMAETIRASEIGPDVAYYLGSNPKEAARISRLSPFLQAKEIGRIEAKLADAPPVKKTTSAPEPIKPVTARATTTGAVDTTDPRSAQSMSTSEWIEAERRRQIAKLQARQLR